MERHCRLFLGHGINLDTTALHMQDDQFHRTVCHSHSSCFFSNARHNILHPDNRKFPTHFSVHHAYIQHTCPHFHRFPQQTLRLVEMPFNQLITLLIILGSSGCLFPRTCSYYCFCWEFSRHQQLLLPWFRHFIIKFSLIYLLHPFILFSCLIIGSLFHSSLFPRLPLLFFVIRLIYFPHPLFFNLPSSSQQVLFFQFISPLLSFISQFMEEGFVELQVFPKLEFDHQYFFDCSLLLHSLYLRAASNFIGFYVGIGCQFLLKPNL